MLGGTGKARPLDDSGKCLQFGELGSAHYACLSKQPSQIIPHYLPGGEGTS
jgi:hypothetical protein